MAPKTKDRTLLGIVAKKEEDFSKWYVEVVIRGELLDYYDVSGCYIYRPWSFEMWEYVQAHLDGRFKRSGVKNAYFPLLVPKSALEREKDHIAGFAPEVAWVTRSGDSELEEPLAVRPTSETVMYSSYAKWIKSHRDMPLRLNQWCNVLRWEFKHAVPFLRGREFLWQEGHSAFARKEEADAEVLEILGYYEDAYQNLLAVPVIRGIKSDKEKFDGADYTTTLEGYIPVSGRAIQAATSHHLGQNFSKMFNIKFEDGEATFSHAWQNSWGFSTRALGVMTMVHGDNKGLVLPPRAAPIQVVIVPIIMKKKEELVLARCAEVVALLQEAGVRVHLDDRAGYNPGFKYNHWELKGVPIRMDIGPRDVGNNVVVLTRRDWREGEEHIARQQTVAMDALVADVRVLLDSIHDEMFRRAKKEYDDHIRRITSYDELVPALNEQCVVLAPWCDRVECEESVKKRSGKDAKTLQEEDGFKLAAAAKSLCKPLVQPELAEGTGCFACDDKATTYCLFGRSY